MCAQNLPKFIWVNVWVACSLQSIMIFNSKKYLNQPTYIASLGSVPVQPIWFWFQQCRSLSWNLIACPLCIFLIWSNHLPFQVIPNHNHAHTRTTLWIFNSIYILFARICLYLYINPTNCRSVWTNQFFCSYTWIYVCTYLCTVVILIRVCMLETGIIIFL